MKNFSLPVLIIFSLFLSFSAHAVTLQESLKQLQQYTAKDFEKTKTQTDKDVSAKVQEMLNAIEQSTELALKEQKPLKAELLKELARVSVLTFQEDPSEAATELILPLYKKEKKAFEKAIKSLPESDRKELEESLKNTAREETQGNG